MTRLEIDSNEIILKKKKSGDGGNRTPDTRIFSPLLYQLSYITVGLTRDLILRALDRGTKLDKFIFGPKQCGYFLGI
jgi:hypothetical protein